MIVNYVKTGWQIITQRSHGLLAAQICARWKITDQPDQWVDTLIAVAEHDDVFNEFERDPLINTFGGPIDFKMNSFDEDASKKLMDMAITKSAFIALLTAKHIVFTHGDDPTAKQFIKELNKADKERMKVAAVTKNDVDRSYELLEFCDAFSLLICQNMIQPEQRSIEISNGPSGKSYSFSAKGDKLMVSPWPFEINKFDVSFECRLLNKLEYPDNESFRKDLRSATVERRVLQISKI